MRKKLYLYILFVIVLFLIDQLTKLIVINTFNVNDKLIIIDNFLKFYYIKNTGISFGMLSNQSIVIISLTILIIVYMIYETIRNKNNNLILLSSSLIIGGALGNLVDRIFRGYVIDFISFTIFNKEMAIFNVADMLITFGIIIYIYIIFREGKYERNSSR